MRLALQAAEVVAPGKLSASRPGVLAAGVLAASACLVFTLSLTPRQHSHTVSDVLSRATELDDSATITSQPGIIFHRLEITAGKRRFEWSSYRDRQGKHKALVQTMAAEDANFRVRLANAGIPNDDPLSATSFRLWRNRLGKFSDNVARVPSGLFIITTTVMDAPANSIKAETLTLRDDYHPIRRTVVFRDNEEIQVAELDYRVLGWNEVPPGLFGDTAVVSPIAAPLPSVNEEALTPVLSDSDLTLAELQTRLALSQSNLDVNEHVEVQRLPEGVLVHGFVTSPEREREIHTALASIPHVRAEVQLPSDSEPRPDDGAGSPPAITVMQSVSQPSPLYTYWKGQNRNLEELPHLTASVLDASLRINQQSRALRELAREFASGSALDERSREALRTLIQDHLEKLRAALETQQQDLKTLNAPSPSGSSLIVSDMKDGNNDGFEALDRRASHSMTLCRQLSAGDESNKFAAETLILELNRELMMMAATLDRLSSHLP